MWESILLQIALVLLMRWLSGDRDSSAVETKIFNTTDKDEMIELVAGRVIADVLKDKALDPTTELIITGLVNSGDEEALAEIVSKPETKKSIANSIGGLISGLFGM